MMLKNRLALYLATTAGLVFAVSHAAWAQTAVVPGQGGTLTVLDTATKQVTETISGVTDAFDAALKSGNWAYVTGNGGVTPIELKPELIKSLIPIGKAPFGIAFLPDRQIAYATDEESTGIRIIDVATGKVIGTMPTTYPGENIVVSPDGSSAYEATVAAGAWNAGAIVVVDTATETIRAQVPVQNFYPYAVAITPDGTTALFTYINNVGDIPPNQLAFFDTATDQVTATITVGNYPLGVATAPSGALAYVTNYNDNTVSVVDWVTRQVVDTIAVGQRPWGVAVTPSGSKVFVANHNDGTVSVINAVTRKIEATIAVGSQPTTIAMPR